MNDINHKRGRDRALSILSECLARAAVHHFFTSNHGNSATAPIPAPHYTGPGRAFSILSVCLARVADLHSSLVQSLYYRERL